MPWSHFSLISGSPVNGDARCATAPDTELAFITTGDYDGDGIDEIVVGIKNHPSKTTSNDLWAMKFDGNAFQHMTPPSGPPPLGADIDCSAADIAATWAVSGDFDGDGRDEIAVRNELVGTDGNDLWVQKFIPAQSGAAAHFEPFAPLSGHWFGASVDCSALPYEAYLMATGDFDGDGQDELVIGNRQTGTGGNDFWVQKWDPNTGMFSPMSMIPGHPLDASIDCSTLNSRAAFLAVGDFDGDGADEIAFGINRPGTEGNDLWVQKWHSTGFQPWALISGHPLGASIDCSIVDRAARFAVTGDFDGDGRDEIAVAIGGHYRWEQNSFWVQKWDPNTGMFGPMSIIAGNPLDASIDCGGADLAAGFAVVGDFDGDGSDELAAFIEDHWGSTAGNEAWTQKLVFGSFMPFDPPPGVPSPTTTLDCSLGTERAMHGAAGRFSADQRYAVAALPDSTIGPDLDFWVMSSCLAPSSTHTLAGTATIASTSLPSGVGSLPPIPFSLGFDLSACTRTSGSVTSWFLGTITLATCPLPVVGSVPNNITTSLVDSWLLSYRRITGSMSFWLKLRVSHSAPVPTSEIDLFFDTGTALAPPFIGAPMAATGSISLVGTGKANTVGTVTMLLSGTIAPIP